jgi:hypothetical protein
MANVQSGLGLTPRQGFLKAQYVFLYLFFIPLLLHILLSLPLDMCDFPD